MNNATLARSLRSGLLSAAAVASLAGCGGPFTTRLEDYGPRTPFERLRDIQRLPAENYIAADPVVVEEPTADPFAGLDRVELTLEEARAWTLQNNLNLRVALIDPVIANETLNFEEGRFDSVFFGNFRYTNLNQPTSSTLSGSEVEAYDFDAGVRIPMRTGGQIVVNLPGNSTETNNQFSFLNPAYTTDYSISISQPLLRGAGRRANTNGIRVAAINTQISQARTKLEVIRQLAEVERVYWRLYAATAALEVSQKQYELATEQLERARRLVKAGNAAEVEVIRSESGVADRLEAIIIAVNAMRTSQRDLKRIMNQAGLEISSPVLLVPSTPPDPVDYEFTGETLAKQAVDNRMEMLELELQLAQDASIIDFERNAALPLFTVDYTYRLNGLGDSWRNAFDSLSSTDFGDHVVSVGGEIPLGNVQAKARVQQAILRRLQRLSTKEAREQAIRQEVLNAVDNVESDWQRILAARQASILNGRTLAAEQRQFDVGARTSTDVLDAATRLADSQLAEIRALAEHQISLVDLAFATGTLLGAARVSWDPLDPRPDGPTIPPAPWGGIQFTRENSGEHATESPTPGNVRPAYLDD
mgnify:CR=1 FL=1